VSSDLPLYAVKWVPLEIAEPIVGSAAPKGPFVVNLSLEISSQAIIEEAAASLRSGVKVLVTVPSPEGLLEGAALEDEQKVCWHFVTLSSNFWS
jgi:hypothetical protein